MRPAAAGGLLVTAADDARVTGLGRLLRASKLDELPQLWNVVKGEMSIVGPRPEVARYVARYSGAQRRVLEVRPGLTDPASLAYRHEERLISSVPAEKREAFYVFDLMPRKLALNLDYLDRAGPLADLRLMVRTVGAVLGVGSSSP